MMTFALFLISLSAAFVPSEAAWCDGAGMEIYPTNGHCYVLGAGNMDYEGAILHCESYYSTCESLSAAHLVDFNNTAEEQFVQSLFAFQPGRDYWTALRATPDNETDFRWITNSQPPSYTNWYSGQPTSGSQDCVLKNYAYNYQWDDVPCVNAYYPVCELEP